MTHSMNLSTNPGYRRGTVPIMKDPMDSELRLQLADLRGALGADGSRGPINALLHEALREPNTCMDLLTYR